MQNNEDVHSCFVFKLAMLYANDYFFNAVPVSDRPIYRAGGSLQILGPFDFHCMNKNSFPHYSAEH